MGIVYLKLKALMAATGLLAASVFGNGTDHAMATIARTAKSAVSRTMRFEVSAPSTPAAADDEQKKPTRVVLTKKLDEHAAASPTSTPAVPEKKSSRNPFQWPPKTGTTPLPAPSVKPTPKPKQTPIPSPTPLEIIHQSADAGSQGTGSLTRPTPTPDISIGALLISNNPPYVKMGSAIAFTVFVRDGAEAAVKNTMLGFSVNGKNISATTDENGNAFLEIPAPTDFIGKLDVRVELYGKQASFVVEVVDTKPSLALSSFAFTVTGFHVRLRNAAGESVVNWQVSEIRRDGTVMATKLTNELGVIEFELPPREAGGHLYACADVKDIGKQCIEW